MRINVDIDDRLINDVIKLTKVKTKKEAIENALKEYFENPQSKRIAFA